MKVRHHSTSREILRNEIRVSSEYLKSRNQALSCGDFLQQNITSVALRIAIDVSLMSKNFIFLG